LPVGLSLVPLIIEKKIQKGKGDQIRILIPGDRTVFNSSELFPQDEFLDFVLNKQG